MSKKNLERSSYLYAGCILSDNRIVLLSRENYDTDQASCVAFFLDQTNTNKLDLSGDFFVGVVELENQVIFAAQFGSTKIVDWQLNVPWGNIVTSGIDHRINDTENFGELTKIRVFDSSCWICGQFGQLYKLSNRKWVRADQGLRSLDAPDFEDIAGKSETDIVGCGLFGELNRFDGTNWKNVDSSTNQNISVIIPSEDGLYYAAGYNGLVLRGKEDTWSTIGESAQDKNYEDLAFHEGKLFLLYPRGIDTVTVDSITPIEGCFDPGVTFRKFACGHGRLVALCEDSLYEHSNGHWHSLAISV